MTFDDRKSILDAIQYGEVLDEEDIGRLDYYKTQVNE